jgi:heterodisulfide reductase subunit B
MKEFAYFPGCSLEKMAISYHLSALETTRKLGIKLSEIEDWNCCGATAYYNIDELLTDTLCARNLWRLAVHVTKICISPQNT